MDGLCPATAAIKIGIRSGGHVEVVGSQELLEGVIRWLAPNNLPLYGKGMGNKRRRGGATGLLARD